MVVASSATPSGNDASPASAVEARTDRPSATRKEDSPPEEEVLSQEEGESAQKVVYFLN